MAWIAILVLLYLHFYLNSIIVWVFCGSEIKERIKKTKDEKKAKKAEVMAKTQKASKSMPKGGAPKGPKLGGGGGKRWAFRSQPPAMFLGSSEEVACSPSG